MIAHGLKKIIPDKRNYSLHRTFGSIATTQYPDELTTDAGLTNPNQNADRYPEGCTGYAQAELCGDQDKVIYKPSYTYSKTCLMQGIPLGSPCDIQTSLKSTIVFGVERADEVTDQQAMVHHRGQYFQVERQSGMDWFDSFRSALYSNRRSISIGTPWYGEWNRTLNTGIIHAPILWDTDGVAWHNWKICGWKTIDGIPYLVGKVWLGPTWANKGFGYFSREIVNQAMSIQGTGAFTLASADPSNIQTVRLSIIQTILMFYYRLQAFVL